MNIMKKFLKKSLRIVGLAALFAIPVQAADEFASATVAPNTPLTLLTGGKYIVKNILFVNTNSTTGTLWFYDSAANSTSIVRGAYTSYSTTTTTNWSQIFTNGAGVVITNISTGIVRVPTSVAAVTNERPKNIGPIAVTASGTATGVRSLEGINAIPALGLTIYSTTGGTVEIVYDQMVQ